ncbi:MAG: DUF1987 domain-containing protein [Flavobacteriales bacterium]|nr:DUF1987 domain-containing protein [Flavobacteriales bacterium]HMQ76241.1 DUF1987 domain-containing protein [Flavobacteriales bacterium]HMR27790.1 DUF1987 domain-containing protein [Flavobacteriales bacterium]
MERFELAATAKTPRVLLDPSRGVLELSGSSIHENADKFYRPIFDHLRTYLAAPQRNTVIRIDLEYFNSSSAKYLLDLLRIVDDGHAAGRTAASVEWGYRSDDLDMREVGEDYRGLLDMPVRLVQRRT